MPTFAWLTPDTITVSRTVCWTLVLPNVQPVLRVVRGALQSLQEPENWEQYGTMSPDDTAAYMQTVMDEMSQNMCPIGMIAPFLTTSVYVPAGWLLCDGTVYAKANYPDLYARLAHNPPVVVLTATEFTITMTGLFLRGLTGSVGDSGGESVHTLTKAEIPPHTHGYWRPVLTPTPIGLEAPATLATGEYGTVTSTGAGLNGDAHENKPPYVEITWAIYAGV